MIMYAIINGSKVECVYVEPREGTIEVDMPDNWKEHEITYDNGIVLGEKIDNKYKPLE
jgi:phage-related protein